MSRFVIDSEGKLDIAVNLLKTNDPTLRYLLINSKYETEVKTCLRLILPHLGKHLTHLRSIKIGADICSDDGEEEEIVEQIALLINKKILCLNEIQFCPLPGLCGAIAMPLLNNSHLHKLDFYTCGLETNDAEILARVLRHRQCSLKDLCLADNRIGDGGCCAIMDALHHNSSLKCLDLYSNDIGKEGCRAIARALQNNGVILEDLKIDDNFNVGDDGCVCIADALAKNTSLRVLRLDRCDISDEGWGAMKQALQKNYSLHELSGEFDEYEYFWSLLVLNAKKPMQAQATKTGIFPTQLLISSKEQGVIASDACNAEMLGKVASYENLSALFSFVKECPSFFESNPLDLLRQSKRLKLSEH